MVRVQVVFFQHGSIAIRHCRHGSAQSCIFPAWFDSKLYADVHATSMYVSPDVGAPNVYGTVFSDRIHNVLSFRHRAFKIKFNCNEWVYSLSTYLTNIY